MKWPPWSFSTTNSHDNHRPSYTSPEFIIACIAASTSALLGAHVYRNYVRRIPTASHISPRLLRRRSLFGHVTSVGDGDNFRVFHTPGGRLLGWGWLPGRKIPTARKDLKDQTVHVRLAGIDAPECAHFGNKAQPYSAEALAWLKAYVGDRRVRAYLHSKDQFDRVVATVKVRRGLQRRDVGLEMLKAGMATVYEAKTGAEFGNMRSQYEEAEARAKRMKVGLWRQPKRLRVSPHEYKQALKQQQV
ncbi:SNase-domain-containing protein [Wilcoxina mikolae CBS 423.85]|nr:SNase-domain-containing protein [Wilcoxina mikolae CBS 423.85]